MVVVVGTHQGCPYAMMFVVGTHKGCPYAMVVVVGIHQGCPYAMVVVVGIHQGCPYATYYRWFSMCTPTNINEHHCVGAPLVGARNDTALISTIFRCCDGIPF